MPDAPVITIDGSSGVGKGTISRLLAAELGWHYLDSGALYRAVAWAVSREQLDFDDDVRLEQFVVSLPIEFIVPDYHLRCLGVDITDAIRTEACGQFASTLAAKPLIRNILFDKQLAFQAAPGLVTDGRDMGTVVFPGAAIKFFFSASAEKRAERRYKQLKEKGGDVTLRAVLAEIVARDHRDQHRDVAPLKPASDAVLIDTTDQSVEETFADVLTQVQHTFAGNVSQ